MRKQVKKMMASGTDIFSPFFHRFMFHTAENHFISFHQEAPVVSRMKAENRTKEVRSLFKGANKCIQQVAVSLLFLIWLYILG